MTDTAHAAAAAITALKPDLAPRIGLVLGSGLGRIAERIDDAATISYGELPGFPVPSVAGHAGRLVLGRLAGVPVACLQGRVHLYEGAAPAAITGLIRPLKLIGCEALLVFSAAGSLSADVGPGRLMLVADHINLQGANPLVGPNDARFGPRFPDMTVAYDADLRQRLRAAARDLAIDLAEGVYAAVLGPSFETPAEIRALRVLGADAVGMSMVPEVTVARHCGLKVAGICLITNLAAGMTDGALGHDQTLAVAEAGAGDLSRLVSACLAGSAEAA